MKGDCPFLYECEKHVPKRWFEKKCKKAYWCCSHYRKEALKRIGEVRKPRDWENVDGGD